MTDYRAAMTMAQGLRESLTTIERGLS